MHVSLSLSKPLLRSQIPNVIVESDSPTKEHEFESLAIEDAAHRMEGAAEHSTSAPMDSTPEASQPPITDANYLPGKCHRALTPLFMI